MDIAPKSRTSLWLALMYISNSAGVAFGYVYGAVFYAVVGNWHWVFIFEAFLMAPLLLILVLAFKSPHITIAHRIGSRESMSVCYQLK